KNLLVAFDAFGTLFKPKAPIQTQYGEIARRYGIDCNSPKDLKLSFSAAFKEESREHPNYGKATGLGAEKWWSNVISKTFEPFLKNGQEIPQQMTSDMLTRFSTKEGYMIYPDVLPFFQLLLAVKTEPIPSLWGWDKTVVGVVTNSDDRVPGILETFGLKIGPRRVGSSIQRSAEASICNDISFVVLSYDVGHEKPDPQMFDAAKQMLRETLTEKAVDAEAQSIDDFELLFVGDSLMQDVRGAERAGWNAVLVDRE
ncbi:hypothetical protein K469DRAFT_491268, partial [Zopfia rhizophila CBS 207.26]